MIQTKNGSDRGVSDRFVSVSGSDMFGAEETKNVLFLYG